MNTPDENFGLSHAPTGAETASAPELGVAPRAADARLPYYALVSAYGLRELEQKVNSTMQGGFRPCGGVTFSPALNEYFQAMLFEPNNKLTDAPNKGPSPER